MKWKKSLLSQERNSLPCSRDSFGREPSGRAFLRELLLLRIMTVIAVFANGFFVCPGIPFAFDLAVELDLVPFVLL